MIDFKKIQKECPKSWELLKGWANKLLIGFKTKMQLGGENTEEIVLPIMDDTLAEAMVQAQFRNLFDFFDSNNTKVFIYDIPDSGKFVYYINSGENSEPYNSRIEAEIAAFEAASQVLEGSL